MSDLKFNCLHCNQPLEAPEDMLGQMIDCPACNGSITIPVSAPKPAARTPPVLRPVIPPQPVAPAPTPSDQLPLNVKIVSTETSGFAVASMVIGILAILGGWFWSGVILPILAIIFGHVALSKIKKQSPRLSGRGFAITGLTLGYVSFVIAVIAALVIGSAMKSFDDALKQMQKPPTHVRH